MQGVEALAALVGVRPFLVPLIANAGLVVSESAGIVEQVGPVVRSGAIIR